MSWRERQKAAILHTLRSQSLSEAMTKRDLGFTCDATELRTPALRICCDTQNTPYAALKCIAFSPPNPELHIDCDAYKTPAAVLKCDPSAALTADLCIRCDAHETPPEVLRVSTPFEKSELPLVAQGYTIHLSFSPTFSPCDAMFLVDVSVATVDLVVKSPIVHKFAFSARRERRGLFGLQRPNLHRRAPARLIPKVPPAPPVDKADRLEDRLRWILTPPIHELLSDPSLGLPDTPYDYQVRGIAWLRGRDGALLADEMGLGKTMQAIIAARLLWRDTQVKWILVVCPKTLIGTWRDEINKWWPSALENLCEPTTDTRRFLKLAMPGVTLKIINYEKLAREADWLAKGERCGSHDLIIIDEAQCIKSPGSKTARAVKALQGRRHWALTGTPLETKTGDVVSIFDFVRPGLLRGDDPDYVRDKIKPFMLRRRVEDVLEDLPDKDDRDVDVDLAPKQREVYDRAEDEGVVELNAKGDTISVQHVFALIQTLMQLCNFDPVSGESSKLERLKEDLEEIIDSGRKVLVFSRFVSELYGLNRMKRALAPLCSIVEMHGKITQKGRDAAIEAFARDPSINTMLLQYRVGGRGLNLQAANYVYLFDRWWNPAVEDQAVKRVHRIGQKNKVFVRRLFCRDTIEDRILQKLAERRRLFAHVIDEERAVVEPHEAMGLTEEELFSLFKNLKARPKQVRRAPAPARIILDNMDPNEFENLVAKVYEARGFKARVVGGSHDGGIDILAERTNPPGRDRVVVQCKHTKANVGRPEVQKLFGVVSADPGLTRGDLITSADFTAEAYDFAKDKRLELVNRDALVKLAQSLGVAEFQDV